MNILDLLFPRRCVSCGKTGGYFCAKCKPKIEYLDRQICPVCARPSIDGFTHKSCRTKYGLDGLFAACKFKGPVKDAVHILKYRYVSDLGKDLSAFITDIYPEKLLKFDIIIPVPLSKNRMQERGFNQAEIISANLSMKWGIRSESGMFERKKNTKPQADLNEKERKINVKFAFSVNNPIRIRKKKIALVDDVSTTRFTLTECADVLKRGGAESVFGIVLAHG